MGLGAHDRGKSSTQFSMTKDLPDVVIVALPFFSESSNTSEGMPLTPKAFESFSFWSRASYGRANQCSPMDWKYDAQALLSLSLETKAMEASGYFFSSSEKNATNFGVKPRQGGHQCAEKYNSKGPGLSDNDTSSPSLSTKGGNADRMSWTDGGFQGKASGSDDTPSRPSRVMVSPVLPSKITSVGMPLTLYFLDRAFLVARSLNGNAAQAACSS